MSTGLSPLLTAAEMEHQLIDSGTKLVITVDILFEKIAEVAAKTPFTTVVVTEIADFLPGIKRVLGKLLKKIPTAEVKPIPGKSVKRFMDVMNESKADPVQVKRSFDDMIFMMYTGGTTGPAKGAMLTQRSYMSNRHQTLTWLDIQSDDIALSAFPLFHIAGLALGGFSITNGITQICVPNPRDSHFLIESLKAYKPTFVVNVPTVYFELLKQPAFRKLGSEEPPEMVPQRCGSLPRRVHQGSGIDYRRRQFHRTVRHDRDVAGHDLQSPLRNEKAKFHRPARFPTRR